MFSKASLMGIIALSLSSRALATDGGHDGPSESPFCPASCIQTVTITSTTSCLEQPVAPHTSTAPIFETRTNDGVYVNATTLESSSSPHTTIIIMPTGVISGSASMSEHTPARFPQLYLRPSQINATTTTVSANSSAKHKSRTSAPHIQHL